jgi:hypothetical protein
VKQQLFQSIGKYYQGNVTDDQNISGEKPKHGKRDIDPILKQAKGWRRFSQDA